MLPVPSVNDVINIRLGDSIFSRQPSNQFTILDAAANCEDLSFRQFGIAGRFASSPCVLMSALLHHIRSIFFWFGGKQVTRIYTCTIVTVVAHIQTLSDWTIGQAIGEFMRPAQFNASPKLSIAGAAIGCYPQPTAIRTSRLVNLFPISALWRNATASIVMSTDKPIGFAFHMPHLRVIFQSNIGLLPTTAMAIAVGNLLRGWFGKVKLELHEKVSFSCQAQGLFLAAAWVTLLVATGVIVAHLLNLTNFRTLAKSISMGGIYGY